MSDQPGSSNYGAAPPNGANTPWTPSPPVPPAPPSSARRRSGVAGGFILIAIGLLFLAGQIVPGLAWWRLWPALIVFVGAVQMFTPSHHDEWGVERIMDGVGTVLFGLVLLGNTLGIVSWTVWWTLLMLWPVLLIALGVSILGRGLHQSWLRAMAPLLIWIALGYAVATSFTGVGGFRPIAPLTNTVTAGQPFAFSEPVGGATDANLNLSAGAGDITLHGGSDLVTAKGNTPLGQPSFSVDRSGGTANVDLALANTDHGVSVPGFSGGGRADVALSSTTAWNATLETGAVNLDADLSDVPIKSLLLKTGASSATLKFGEVPSTASSTDVTVKAGVSSIEILVPRDAELRVEASNGLSTTDVDKRLQVAGGGVWQTPGYKGASKVINVRIESGISSISVQTY